ncbi:MAG: hypothetical protein J7521_07500 [Caulobacter sp.]|nr:hypothetical protein [Caulobacter sp.]
MSILTAFTLFHTALSLVAIVLGIPVVAALTRGAPSAFTKSFILLAALTSITGFFFPFKGVTPAIVVGVIALIVLALVLIGGKRGAVSGGWRVTRSASLVASLWFLVFVAIAQSFAKIPALHALAPTQKEPPFGVAQLVVLAGFVVLGVAAGRKSRRSGALA